VRALQGAARAARLIRRSACDFGWRVAGARALASRRLACTPTPGLQCPWLEN
jgi:hypothetical protein